MRSLQAVLLLCVAISLAPAAVGAEVTSDAAFTAEELQRLAQGQRVERRVTQERGDLRLMGGTSWQVIDAGPDAVWDALLDTSHYGRMLPQVSEARLVHDTGDNRTLFVQHGHSLARTSYYLDVRLDPSRRGMTFHVDESRPRSIRAAWGFYTLRPYGVDKTLLVYGVMADIGDGLVLALIRPSVHEGMMKVPSLVKRFVEGSRARAARATATHGRPG
jgi:hypothetical protein